MASKNINITQQVLFSREQAQEINRTVASFFKKGFEKINIDFTRVKFFSGAFADELYNMKNKYGNQIYFIIKTNPLKMYRAIENRRKKIETTQPI
ncbi:MAG: hypothetical protein HY840_10920 [Bacteroidetes bacterium]|nr:hypothetical protein [Bacteroidota bacterium]